MTTALLVLLGLWLPGPATALQFDTFGMSAVITPPGRGDATFTITAPDFVVSGGFWPIRNWGLQL
jgi:hypothetical protein